VTVVDLTAIDPDDDTTDLVYTVSNTVNGFLTLAHAADARISTFTQADLEANNVSFRHDGSAGDRASFDVVVTDASGATSGAPRTVVVTVHNHR
jgi:hypothetical protein